MSHFLTDGVTLCGKPDGHTGQHMSMGAVQRNRDLQARRDARRRNPQSLDADPLTRLDQLQAARDERRRLKAEATLRAAIERQSTRDSSAERRRRLTKLGEQLRDPDFRAQWLRDQSGC